MWEDGPSRRYYDGWQMMDGSARVAVWVMLALLVLVLVGATVAIFVALRRSTVIPAPPSNPLESAAKHALDERFARGEIDEDEYRKRRSILLET